MKKPEIKMVPVTDLKHYENNSRTHSDEQIAQIGASISEFGFTAPVLINPSNRIIAGHGRVLAAGDIGIEEIPCIVLEGLTEAQERAYVIADNKLTLNSAWDYEMLEFEITELKELDFEIELLGFDLAEFNFEKVDYSLLEANSENLSEVLESKKDNVMRGIQLEFKPKDYKDAYELVKFWREKDAYIGGIIISALKSAKAQL